jgi:regulator of protease activity HflC (stomatin/prohibitin superfamily)
MGWFVLAIIIWVIALACLLIGIPIAEESGAKAGFAAGAVILVLIGFGAFALSGVKSVPVKNIGVSTSFGSVGSSVYNAGTYETWDPFLHLVNINETVQTTTFEDTGNDAGSSCNGGLSVRIGGQQTACADVTIQWQIKPSAAGSLFSDYANTGNFMGEITNAVVVRELKQVVNTVLGDYNPITDVQAVTNTPTATSQFSTFGPTILTDMRADIGSRINVLTVLLPQLHYSSSIESKLASIQQAYANYAIAQENVLVNRENSQALVKLGNPTLPQLVAECLTDLKDGMNAPVGFQCIPSTGSSLSLSSGK